MWISWFLPAAAQVIVPSLDSQLYRAPIDSERTLWTESAGEILDEAVGAPKIALHYVNRPLVYQTDSGEVTALVSDALELDAVLGAAFDRFRVALYLPVYLYADGDLSPGGPGLGDISLDGRVTLLDAADAPLGLGVSARLGIPSSSLPVPLGEDGFSGEIWAIAEKPIDDALIVANLGVRIVPSVALENVDVGDQFAARLGGAYQVSERVGLSADLHTRVTLADAGNEASIPIEAMLGTAIRASDQWVVRLGAGRGLTPGIGSPAARVVLVVGYDEVDSKDTDLDGIVDDVDACPTEPEDLDVFEDANGCPDPDNDQDGLLDAADQCINDPEDPDGYSDLDGCPDPSSQVEIIVQDKAGKQLGMAKIVVTGPQPDAGGVGSLLANLHEGTYTATAQLDGYRGAPLPFQMPRSEEGPVVVMLESFVELGDLRIVVVDEAGAPVTTAVFAVDGAKGPSMTRGAVTIAVPAGPHDVAVSAEGFVTQVAKLTIPAVEGLDHRVVLAQPRVVVTKERIEIKGTIYFDTGKAVIQARSFDLLSEVAQVLVDHPELQLIRIEGHTDSRGSASANLDLSNRRAASVRTWLIEHAVAASRLNSIGYGEDRPVDPREVTEAWDKNRRVDFFVEKRE